MLIPNNEPVLGGHTRRDLADVGLSLVTLGIIPGPVEPDRSVHTNAALILDVTGLSRPPLCKEHRPVVCPCVRAILLHHNTDLYF